jgi:hypothetical protein
MVCTLRRKLAVIDEEIGMIAANKAWVNHTALSWNSKYSKEPCGIVVNRSRQALDELFYKQNLCPRNWVRYTNLVT